jgi:hypothetical protein
MSRGRARHLLSVVQPVNAEVMRWPLDAIPPDWTKRRDRWEYGHALRAGLVAAALGALVTSIGGEESAVTSTG